MEHTGQAVKPATAVTAPQNVAQNFAQLFLLFFFTVLYNLFFWDEDWGLNLFIFNTLILTALCYLFRQNLQKNQLAWLLLSGTIIASFAVLYHNTLNSKIAWIISFIATTAALQTPNLRILLNTWTFSLLNLFSSFGGLYREISQILISKENAVKSKKISRNLKLAIIPAVIFVVFYSIFLVANPVFASYNSNIFDEIARFFGRFFENISFERTVFVLFGFWLISAVIYRWNIDKSFDTIRILGIDLVIRKKKEKVISTKKIVEIFENQKDDKNDSGDFQKNLNENQYRNARETQLLFKSLDLKNEVQMAFLVVISVNLLLLVVNIIDIRFLWFGFEPSPDVSLAALVHQGTYMLIFSILLSMAILMYYFRYNINFYKKNTLLKSLAIVWLVQNGILIISVFFRCYHYISEYGLAYKRIGVIIFLILTIIGLITFYSKIRHKKSAYYLLRVNSLAAYVMLIAMSFVNWDNLIVSENLKHPNWNASGDIDFTTSRSDSTLPILYENEKIVTKKSAQTTINHKEFLDNRKKRFIKHYESTSWLSWNVTSAGVYARLKE